MSCLVGLTDLAQSLIDVGTNLLNSHSSIEHLLNLLDQTETLLRDVGQDQPLSMQNALIPTKKALVSVSLSNHPDSDVRVSVVSCLHEIMRITAPEAPYGDHQMREIFRLTIEAFDKLADASSRSYKKAVAVLDIVSKVKSCIVMLDLECNDLILEMFQKFLKIIRPNHHRVVFSSMEMILITIIDETDEVSKDLLDILLASVKKENQNVSPMSWSLAEKVLSRCARKLQPYIIKALNSSTTSVDMYSPVVLSISQIVFETPKVNNIVNTKEDEAAETNLERRAVSGDSLEDKMELGQNKSRSKRPARDGIRRANENDKPKNGSNSTLRQSLRQVRSGSADAEPESGIIGKRGRKPNSLMEGYDVSWVSGRRDTLKTSSSKKIKRKVSGGEVSLRKVAAKKTPLLKETSSATSRALTGSLKRSRVKIDESDLDSDSPSSPRLKKLALCVRDEEPREEESDQESFEQLEAERNIGSPSKKTRSHNGSEKSQETAKKQPDGEVTSSGKRFSARSEAKRNNSKGASLDTPVPQTLKSKRKVSQFGSTQLVKESPKSHPTRRQTARKEVSDMNVSGKDLVGKRVNIWWPLDKTYYEGVVDSYCSRRKTHRIMYTDGESERLNLSKERWELLEDLSSDSEHEMEIDLPETIPLSNFIQKQKSKKNKNVAASVEPTSSSGLRSSSRTSMKKNSGKKLNNEVKRGKGVSKADSVSEEPKKTNLKSLKELNAESDRAEEQEVSQELDHESEGDDCSEKQEQSENNDSEAETKEEEKQDPNSEVESEGEGSESEDEPKWRETDDMEDEAEEEREEGDDDKGTRTDDMEDETDEEIEEDKGTRTKNMEDEDEDTRTEDMEDEAEEESDDDKGTGTKDMENEAEERGEEDKGTRTEDMEGEAEEEGEENKGTMAENVEDEAEEEKKESDDDIGKKTEDMEDKAEVEEGDDDKGTRTKDMENEADKEKEEGNDDKGTSLEKEKEEDESGAIELGHCKQKNLKQKNPFQKDFSA